MAAIALSSARISVSGSPAPICRVTILDSHTNGLSTRIIRFSTGGSMGARVRQNLAPMVLGMISERIRMASVITADAAPR